MLLEDYAQNDAKNATKALKKHKSHGSDGIPAEAYKETHTWIREPLTQMINEIKMANNYQQNGKTGRSYTYTKTKET